MRATIETHESSRTLPPVKIMIALGGEDLSIKVSHSSARTQRRSGNDLWYEKDFYVPVSHPDQKQRWLRNKA